MSILTQADQLAGLYESVKDKMTGQEILHMDIRFKEFDQLFAESGKVEYQTEVLAEIESHLKALNLV